MQAFEMIHCLECNPVIAAVQDDKWDAAITSPAQVIFYLSANLLSIQQRTKQAHDAGKLLMVHIDLAEGIGKDRIGVRFLAQCGVDGIITTKTLMIRLAKEQGLLSVQRFFVVDTKGMDSIEETLKNTNPDMIEIMPGLILKAIKHFDGSRIPVIAGGLIQTKCEVMDALAAGALAVSSGQTELWYI